MEDLLDVKKIVSKELSSQQEHELLESTVTKIEESETGNKNAVNLCVKSSFENQVEGSQIETSHKEIKTIEEIRVWLDMPQLLTPSQRKATLTKLL